MYFKAFINIILQLKLKLECCKNILALRGINVIHQIAVWNGLMLETINNVLIW